MLEQRDLVRYLLRRNLISAESLVDGDLAVVDATRRNRNFKLTSDWGPCYFIKQGISRDGFATVAHEAAVYQSLGVRSSNVSLARYLPTCQLYDPGEGVLVLDLLQDGKGLGEYHGQRGRFPVTFGAAIGEALGALHSLAWDKPAENDESVAWGQPPWVLSIHRPPLSIMRDVSGANLDLIKRIQSSPEFCRALDDLHKGWTRDAFIHRDIKGDNIVVSAGSKSGRRVSLKIVDWEIAGVGDACWDVGSVFSDYLGFWVLSMPITAEARPNEIRKLARFPLERMQPAIRAFWQAYIHQMKLDGPTANQYLLRSVRYGAARLVQAGFERMQMSPHLMGHVISLLNLGLGILRNRVPYETIVHLLGIRLGYSGRQETHLPSRGSNECVPAPD